MRAVVSRVRRARVVVGAEVVGEIGLGLLVLVGVARGDSRSEAAWIAGKVADLRLFDDHSGRMQYGLVDLREMEVAVLVVSQFTLHGDARRGRRPSYSDAAPAHQAKPLVDAVVEELRVRGLTVAQGQFGADMLIESQADGPVTILLDTAAPTQSLSPKS